MDFTLKDVRENARVYLSGARTRYGDECQDDPDFIWCDDLWLEVEHFVITFNHNNNLWSVGHSLGDCIFPEEEDITAEEVVNAIHRLSDGAMIDEIS